MDKSNTLESSPAAKTEVDDLMGSENMLALDDMLESLGDDVLESSLYSEIFDTVLNVWKQRERESQQPQSQNRKRFRSLQPELKYPVIYEDDVDSRLPPKNVVTNQVDSFEDITELDEGTKSESTKDDNGNSITKEKSCTEKEQQATVKVADVTKHENSRAQKEQPKTKPTKLTGVVEFTKGDPDDNSNFSPKVTMRTEEKKSFFARRLESVKGTGRSIRKSLSLTSYRTQKSGTLSSSKSVSSFSSSPRPVRKMGEANEVNETPALRRQPTLFPGPASKKVTHPDEKEEDDRKTLREVIDKIIDKIPTEKRAKAKKILSNLLEETKNIAMLTTVLTDKLTKNKKVFGSTLDKILEAEKNPQGIPKVLEVAFDVVARPKNIVTEGIYRQNGNMHLILGLKVDVEKGRFEKLEEVKNVHLITGLVKMFFKELKEPILSDHLFKQLSKFVEDKKTPDKDKKKEGKRTVSQMKRNFAQICTSDEFKASHRMTLLRLLKHCDLIMKNEKENLMGGYNLAIVLGPTLSRLPSSSGNPEDLGREIQLQNNVARLMIEDKQFRWALEDSLRKLSTNLN